jgi:hypothetical protein
MTTTIKLFLLFAISFSYAQNEVSFKADATTDSNDKVESINLESYIYRGLAIIPPDPNKIYALDEIEKKPEFPGDEVALKSYIRENFKTPMADNGKKATGTIFASFVIEKDGSVSEIGILHDYGYGSGDEAIRVLEKMPKWIAGKNDAIPVRCIYSLPIVCDGE